MNATLFDQHEHLARAVLLKSYRHVPTHVDPDDLHSVALVALWEAAGAFDPKLSPRFGPYAVRRIRYALQEYLRASDPLRELRYHRRWHKDQEHPELSTFTELLSETYEATDVPPWERWPDPNEPPEPQVIAKMERERLHDALGQLTRRHREVIRRYYLHEHPIEAIAQDLGLAPTTTRLARRLALAELADLLREEIP